MKCNRCGNEFFVGTVCPNCGNSVPMENANETVAYNDEISVNIDDKNTAGPAVNVYSHGTPQPQEGIFANPNMSVPEQNAYSKQGMTNQNIYGGQNMSGRQMTNMGMYSGQPMSNQMYNGGQPMSNQMYNGGQPVSSQMYNSQPMSSQSMYGYSNTNGANNEPPKKSKLPFIIAGITLAVAVIAIILILVFVVFKKDDDGNGNNNVEVTTEAGSNGHTPSADIPDTTEPDTTEPSTDEPSTEDKTSGNTTSGELLFSNETVDISYDKAYIDDIGYFIIEGQIVNKSSSKIGIGLDSCSLNNVCLDAYIYGSAEADATGEWEFVVEADNFAVTELTNVTDVVMYFSVYDGESYMDIFVDKMTAGCNVEIPAKQLVGKDNWKTVYTDEYCDIAALDCIFDDDGLKYYKTYIKITNKTDKMSTLMADDTESDGINVDLNGGYLVAAPNSTAYMEVYWHKEEVPDSAKKFGEVSMEIKMYDSADYTEYVDTDIKFNTNGIIEWSE